MKKSKGGGGGGGWGDGGLDAQSLSPLNPYLNDQI